MDIQTLFPLLRCPECGGDLAYEAVPQHDPEAGACGLLRCTCFVYPVLDSVPILTQERLAHRSISDDRVVAGGPLPSELATLVAEGRGLDGLLALLAFPICPWPLNRLGAFRRLSLHAPFEAPGLALRKRHLRGMLAHRDTLTAEDWLAVFYWHAPAPFDPFNYFFFRFGQPRHIATLALLSVLPEAEAPLLDLACGYGHFLHSVTFCGGRAAIGLDQNFHQLWVARHYVVPGAAFVCADAVRPLPFRDGVFSAALCADAFQHLHHKSDCLAELARCAGGGPILLASVGNKLVDPPDGPELTPDAYTALLSERPWRVLTGPDLLARYLDRHAPNLTTSSAPSDVDVSKWLYYVSASDEALFRDHGPLAEWPHGVGDVQTNPIYEGDEGRLVFRFPSPWFASENSEMQRYMPAVASPRNGTNSGDDALLAQLVLLGLPKRYARPEGRPRTFVANRMLNELVHRLRP